MILPYDSICKVKRKRFLCDAVVVIATVIPNTCISYAYKVHICSNKTAEQVHCTVVTPVVLDNSSFILFLILFCVYIKLHICVFVVVSLSHMIHIDLGHIANRAVHCATKYFRIEI